MTAMPTTSVANKSGATTVRISLRKIWLSTRNSVATVGKSWPIAAPITIDTKIHTVSDRRPHAYGTSAATASQREVMRSDGEMTASENASSTARTAARVSNATAARRSFDIDKAVIGYTLLFLPRIRLRWRLSGQVTGGGRRSRGRWRSYDCGSGELADALASGASGRKAIGVRVPASAPLDSESSGALSERGESKGHRPLAAWSRSGSKKLFSSRAHAYADIGSRARFGRQNTRAPSVAAGDKTSILWDLHGTKHTSDRGKT